MSLVVHEPRAGDETCGGKISLLNTSIGGANQGPIGWAADSDFEGTKVLR